MTIFLTSDLHFGHINVIKYCNRPFADLDEMHEELINRYNSLVGPDDTCFFLGDICMGTVKETINYVSRLNGHKILIPGNHDRCHPMHQDHKKYQEYKTLYEEHFTKVLYAKTGISSSHSDIISDFNQFIFSHFPYDLEENDHSPRPEFFQYAPKDEGKPLLCGHVHNLWKKKKTKLGTPMLNVGVDVHDYYPITLSAAIEMIRMI